MKLRSLVVIPFFVILGFASRSDAQCTDTLETITGSTYDPAAAGNINSMIAGCTDSNVVVRFILEYTGSGDTVNLSNPISIQQPNGRKIELVARNTNKNDSMVTFKLAGDPIGWVLEANSPAIIRNFGFATKAANNVSELVLIDTGAKGSIIRNCHLYNGDDNPTALGGNIRVEADSVLIDRCVFRSPVNPGRHRAINVASGVNATEIRSSLFTNSTVLLDGEDFQFLANTMVGSIPSNVAALEIAAGVGAKDFRVRHNLFATADNGKPPIETNLTQNYNSRIYNNAYSPSASQGTLIDGVANISTNVAMPAGYANYERGDYPMVQYAADPILKSNSPDFGKVHPLLNAYPSNIPTIESAVNKATELLDPSFLPLLGSTFSSMKVGASPIVGDAGSFLLPSPVKSAASNTSFRIATSGSDPSEATITAVHFDTAYYGSLQQPSNYYFYLSLNSSQLSANDTSSFPASVAAGRVQKSSTEFGSDKSLPLSRELRTGGTIHVKMLHSRPAGFAHVFGQSPLATITGVQEYPINDLSISIADQSEATNGRVTLSVTPGAETIDSVLIERYNSSDALQDAARVARQAAASYTWEGIEKGGFYFKARPIGVVAGSSKTGPASSQETALVEFREFTGDTAYVKPRASCPPGSNGTRGTPFCSIADAVTQLDGKGGVILVSRGEDLVDLQIAAGDTSSLEIIDSTWLTGTTSARQIVKASASSALSVSRANVHLKGFLIEAPSASTSPAVSLSGTGVILEGAVIKSDADDQGVGATAISIDADGTKRITVRNNFVAGFQTAVTLASAAGAQVGIYNNTFHSQDQYTTHNTSVGVKATAAVGAVIANNFFSGIQNPWDAGLQGTSPTLKRNVYTVDSVLMRGLSESGVLARASALSISRAGTYLEDLDRIYSSHFECSDLPGSKPCSPLYAASDLDGIGGLTRDLLGRNRDNRKDVGAFEYLGQSTAPVARLELIAQAGEASGSLDYSIVSYNFDSDRADSIVLKWNTTNNQGSSIASKGHRLSEFTDNRIQGSITGLETGTDYFLFAQFSRNNVGGYVFSATARTDVVFEEGDCDFSKSVSRCPEENVDFRDSNLTWITSFVEMANATQAGAQVTSPKANPSVQAPSYLSLAPLPSFEVYVKDEGLEVESEQTQSFTFGVNLDSAVDLSDYSLFDLGASAGAVPRFVPSWTYQSRNDSTFVRIQGHTSGTHRYAFARLVEGTETGNLIASIDTASRVDLRPAATGDSVSISISLTGTGFRTSNPLVLAVAVPAGAYMGQSPFSVDYFAQPHLGATGVASLSAALRTAVLQEYLSKTIASDVDTFARPMDLPTTLVGQFGTMIQVKPVDFSVNTSGDLAQVQLGIKVSKKDYPKVETPRKTSRSIEIALCVFDAGKVTWSRDFIRTRFGENLLQHEVKLQNGQLWNLFTYPWQEEDPASFKLSNILNSSEWDPKQLTLMKYKGSGVGSAGYSAYNGGDNVGFDFFGGEAVWSASRQNYSPRPFSGTSLDFKPRIVRLDGGQWNDIGLPFNFDIRWGDVLESSGVTGDLSAWVHVPDGSGAWEPLKPDSVVSPWQGITVKPVQGLDLVFPVMEAARSAKGQAAAKPVAKRAGRQWMARLEARNASARMNLVLGKSASPSYFSEAPNVPGQDFHVHFRNPEAIEPHRRTLSEWVQVWDSSGSMGTWSLGTTQYGKDGQGIAMRLLSQEGDTHQGIHLLDLTKGRSYKLSNEEPLFLSSEQLRSGDFHVVAGDDAYLSKVSSRLSSASLLSLSAFPNPFREMAVLRFALPSQISRGDFDLKIYDQKGRVVLENRLQGDRHWEYRWDGRNGLGKLMPRGFYHAVLVVDADGKRFRSETRLIRY